MSNDTAIRFNGIREFIEYANAHPDAMDAVSSARAASILGVGRQRVYDLIKSGKLRAWFIYDPASDYETSDLASVVWVSSKDIDSYRVSPRKRGRPSKSLAA